MFFCWFFLNIYIKIFFNFKLCFFVDFFFNVYYLKIMFSFWRVQNFIINKNKNLCPY